MQNKTQTLFKKIYSWRTEPWFKPTAISIAGTLFVGLICTIFGVHYANNFSNANKLPPPSSEVKTAPFLEASAETFIPGDQTEFSPLLEAIKENNEAWVAFADEQLERTKIDSAKDLARMCNFTFLELNTPNSNATIFLNKFFGLNGEPKLGKSLYNIVSAHGIDWALQIDEIMTDEDDDVYIVAKPVVDPCGDLQCGEGIFSKFIIAEKANSEILLEIKPGDFLFVEGNLHLWDNPPETNWQFFTRMHIHATAYKYFSGGLSDECKEAFSTIESNQLPTQDGTAAN